MKEIWDKRYAEQEYAYGELPNVFFHKELGQLKAGKLLLPAEGEGRNAVYAAKMGWDVTAFDQSRFGQDKAYALADRSNVSINYLVSDIENFEFVPETYDAVGLIFAHVPSALQTYLHHSVIKSLKPGGIVLLEAFSSKQLGKPSGGPKNQDMLFTEGNILSSFAGLSTCEVWEEEVVLNEGPFHQGKAVVIRMVGKK